MKLYVVLLLAAVSSSWAMTVTLKEAEELPDELKPIMPGGSWFDDMALKRLQKKHQDLKELGKLEGHRHEDDSDEMFIISRLKSPHSIITIPPVGSSVNIHHSEGQDTREVMRNFLRHHTQQSSELRELDDDEDDDDDDEDERDSELHNTSSHEFMEMYERELENFFKNFMSAMLQAEVGGVSIETRGEEDRPNRVASP